MWKLHILIPRFKLFRMRQTQINLKDANQFDDEAVVESADLDAHVWFYDPLLQRIRNKANGRSGLGWVERKVKGLVQGRVCDHTASQSWSYNDFKGQIQHLGTIGLCLNVD
ncbi:hypothetical protein H257_14332 [Aphanomyces astaci]|uniref:Uncharacterized protein n=1 Tax=Aphanomyces astaci TaxID=112090 RepID=W4FRS1_APHAT|nr:hypothetical protein H257_14332 [Aphanomyces astaci]ETV70167.1 hypothetical protein H257_14332 [Aphanomyces astaci]|eukprot:XP_009840398.1 hypothetical protein H257_14332 [Aphanomyces astaci]